MFKLPEWGRRESSGPAIPAPGDPLADFNSERAPLRPEPSVPKKVIPSWDDIPDETGRRALVVPLTLVFLLSVGGYFLVRWWPFSQDSSPVTVTIESNPPGAEVFVAGARIGLTPVKMPVAPGDHLFELVYEGRKTPLLVTAKDGAAVVHHVRFDPPPPAPVASAKASLRVVTEPSKLRVLLNGKPLGVSPLLATDLAPGKHKIQVVGTKGTTERRIDLNAGETVSVTISTTAAPATPTRTGPSVGWVTITSTVPLQIVDGKDLIGTSQSARLMLPAGRHNLQLSNESLGIVEHRVVQVSSGGTANIRIDVPNAPLSINALPWAEVWLDGKRLGETPIGNLPVRVGNHEVVFRHPQFGERRKNVTVSLKGPMRVSVDMRQTQ